MKTLGIK